MIELSKVNQVRRRENMHAADRFHRVFICQLSSRNRLTRKIFSGRIPESSPIYQTTVMYDRVDLKINSNYEDDIRYTVQVHRLILSLIGVWPILRKLQHRETLVRVTIRTTCCLLLFFNLIPWISMILIADTLIDKLKIFSRLCFFIMVPILYCALILYENRIRGMYEACEGGLEERPERERSQNHAEVCKRWPLHPDLHHVISFDNQLHFPLIADHS